MPGRWIRLDTTWSRSEWLLGLEPIARLAWVELLCYVKAHGSSGAVKRLSTTVAAQTWCVTRNAVTKMEDAAKKDGALVVDGEEWVVTGWAERQMDPTAAERMRRYRQRQQELKESGEREITRAENGVTRNVTAVTPTETETKTNNNYPETEKEPVSEMWAIWLEVFCGEGRKPKLTKVRSLALRKLYNEQLRGENEPIVTFRRVLKAVTQSEHHMGKREYQYPESIFRNEERRDRWVTIALSPDSKHRDSSSNAGLRRSAQ